MGNPYLCRHKNVKNMATITKRRTATPFAKAWNHAKKLDNSEKLQLITMLAESVRPAVTVPMLDEPVEEFDDMDKEFYTPEEAYELVMKDIKAIYDQKDAI